MANYKHLDRGQLETSYTEALARALRAEAVEQTALAELDRLRDKSERDNRKIDELHERLRRSTLGLVEAAAHGKALAGA